MSVTDHPKLPRLSLEVKSKSSCGGGAVDAESWTNFCLSVMEGEKMFAEVLPHLGAIL